MFQQRRARLVERCSLVLVLAVVGLAGSCASQDTGGQGASGAGAGTTQPATGSGGMGTGTGAAGTGATGSGAGTTGSGATSTSSGTTSTSSGTTSTSSGTTSTSSGTTSTSSGTTSTSSGTTTSSSGDAGADAGVVCSNTDKTILTIDAKGWVDRACNDYNIQGAWYCFADTQGTSNCVKNQVPYVASPAGMCLSGKTSTASGAYGAALGLELNSTGGAMSVKNAYDATLNNVVGFEITITGTTGGPGLRATFTTGASTTATQPFVELPGAGTYQVMLKDAQVPGSFFMPATAEVELNAAAIYDLQLAIPPNSNFAATFDYCITKIKPILASSAPAAPTACGAMTNYGAAVCGPQDLLGAIAAAGQTALYAAQNNMTGNSGSECIQATTGGTCGGFQLSFPNGSFGTGGNAPSSFPSIIYGWQAGAFYGGLRQGRQVSGITSIPTSWSFTTPTGGQWDAVYDVWFTPTANPATAANGVELMVWWNYAGVQPVGSWDQNPKTIAGAPAGTSWEVWTGSVSTWRYIAYRLHAPNSNPVNFDLMSFVKDAETRGVNLSGSSYLVGVQAGFELYSVSAGQTVGTKSFTASVQ
jgi:hypothetical protein